MMLQGHVINGVIVPDVPCTLPEGATVQIEVVVGADEIDKLPPSDADLDELAVKLRAPQEWYDEE